LLRVVPNEMRRGAGPRNFGQAGDGGGKIGSGGLKSKGLRDRLAATRLIRRPKDRS